MENRQDSGHVREHNSLLANSEKRLLIWIAHHLPGWVNSDHLTLLGLGGTIMAGLAFWLARWDSRALFLVVAALGMNWFGDSLDGTLARVRNQLRPHYGFYVDHVIDVVGALFLFGGLAASGLMHPLIAMGLLVGYLLVAAESFLATHAQGVFRLAFIGVGPTELRILLAIGTVYTFFQPMVHLGGFGAYRLFDVGGLVGIGGLGVALFVSAIRNTVALYKAEPLT
jgi:phosphatidylglycerophosphate synthase